MSDWRVPLADVEIGEAEIAAVTDTYRSGWLSMGPRTQELEERFAAYVGTEHAIAVTNGTAALHLICLAAGLGPGDEVIVPSLTFVATVNAVRYTGATPVFADVESLERPWLSAEAVAAAVDQKVEVLVVHGPRLAEVLGRSPVITSGADDTPFSRSVLLMTWQIRTLP